jgi:hypothetical protein
MEAAMSPIRGFLLVSLAVMLAAPVSARAKPKVFDSSPDRSGLLVVDIHWRYKTFPFGTTFNLEGGVIVPAAMMDSSAAPDSTARGHAGIGADDVSGYLVFAAEAGHYRLLAAMGQANAGNVRYSGTVRFDADSLSDLAGEVRVGEATYLGTVEVTSIPHPFRKDETRIHLEANAERRQKALDKLADKAKKTVWEEPLRRLAASTVAEGTSSPPSATSAEPDSTK